MKLFPQEGTVIPLSCYYPIKPNWHEAQPGRDMVSNWVSHSTLQGRKQSIAKRTSGTEKDHLIHNPEVKFYLNTRRWSAPSDLYFLLPPPKTHPLSMGKVVPILAVIDSELRWDW